MCAPKRTHSKVANLAFWMVNLPCATLGARQNCHSLPCVGYRTRGKHVCMWAHGWVDVGPQSYRCGVLVVEAHSKAGPTRPSPSSATPSEERGSRQSCYIVVCHYMAHAKFFVVILTFDARRRCSLPSGLFPSGLCCALPTVKPSPCVYGPLSCASVTRQTVCLP